MDIQQLIPNSPKYEPYDPDHKPDCPLLVNRLLRAACEIDPPKKPDVGEDGGFKVPPDVAEGVFPAITLEARTIPVKFKVPPAFMPTAAEVGDMMAKMEQATEEADANYDPDLDPIAQLVDVSGGRVTVVTSDGRCRIRPAVWRAYKRGHLPEDRQALIAELVGKGCIDGEGYLVPAKPAVSPQEPPYFGGGTAADWKNDPDAAGRFLAAAKTEDGQAVSAGAGTRDSGAEVVVMEEPPAPEKPEEPWVPGRRWL